MNRRTLPAIGAVVAFLLGNPWAVAEQSQRPLPGTFTLGDAPVPSVCVEEGVALTLRPTVYASVGPSLRVRRVLDGKAEEMSLQEAIDRGLLVCRSRENGHLGLAFERKEPGEYVLTVPPDAPAVVARSKDVRRQIEPLVSLSLPRVPDGLAGKALEELADQINREAMELGGPQREQWDQLRKAGRAQLRAAAEGALTVQEGGDVVRLANGELRVPADALFRDLMAATQIAQWTKEDADLAAAAAKWPQIDVQRLRELRRLKRHTVATAVMSVREPGTFVLRHERLPDLALPAEAGETPPGEVPQEWAMLLGEGDLVVDLTKLPEGAESTQARRSASATAAALRRRVPGAKVLLARGPNWADNLRRMWASGPNPVGVIVQPDGMGQGLGAIHAEIVKMFDTFPKLAAGAQYGAIVVAPRKPGSLADLAAEVRTSKTLGGVPVEGGQWLLVACADADNGAAAADDPMNELASALAAAGASQVVRQSGPLNGLAASVAITELFGRLESAAGGANPVELWPEWAEAQRVARQGLSEIQLPPELPASATDLLRRALEQLDEPDTKSGPSADAGESAGPPAGAPACAPA